MKYIFCIFYFSPPLLQNLQDLLLMMGTRILKIDAEVDEKIEVEVCTINTEIICLPFCHWGLPTSTSIFSAISASIFKILVLIIKRISWGFQNTPKHQLSDEYWPRKWQKTKWHKNCFSNLNKTQIFEDLPFSLNCCNLA